MGGLIISGEKVAHDFLLDAMSVPEKFGCTGAYGVEAYEGPTDRQKDIQTNFLLHV